MHICWRIVRLDRFDEVWDGVYVIPPIADNEHQLVTLELLIALDATCSQPGTKVFAGCNVSDRESDWTADYRFPDASVYFLTNPAQDNEVRHLEDGRVWMVDPT